jgi:molybdate transport system substrate-binding protein
VKTGQLSALVMSAVSLLIALGTGAQAADKTTLVALVAPNAKSAFTDIIKTYEKSHPDVTISASFAGSKIIAGEIASGAAADVVLMAQPTVGATNGGLDSPVVVFRNRTAIGVNKSAAAKIKEPKDLAKAGVRVAEGTPGSTVAGFEADAVAKMTAHYGKDFGVKYGGNVATKKTDTTKVAEAVESGSADAAILYEADIDPSKLTMIKLTGEDEVVVPAVVASVKASTHGAQAKDFAKFIAGPESAAIFRTHRHEAAN